ncbi:MAG: LutC/YkgG family protein [Acidocella sp.]|uniref:LutC/YkgG family protein n=1 Tax=Acidocella sp. TaxID=50710 RepID=UPI003FD82210
MSSREAILASVRANLPKVERPLPVVPHFDSNPPASLIDAFGAMLKRMGGSLLDPGPVDDPLAPVRALLAESRLICSAVPEIAGERDLAAVTEPRALADVDHAVVRAAFGVAETGSVLLTDTDLQVNSLAYLAQHLIVLLDPADIVVNLHQAYARPEFREHHYAAFHTGPSATADIEGVLILGAQGVRSLSVLLAPRPSVNRT